MAPTPDRCPIGGNHLNTQQEVNAAIEAEMAAEHDSFSTQKSKKTTKSEVRKTEEENERETKSLIPRDKEGSFGKFGSIGEYYAATDKKHFNGGDGSGSAFTSDSISNLNDLVDEAREQRGSLEGDDREELIRDGANPDAFLSEDKVRYLRVEIEGNNSKIGIGEIDADDDEPVFTAEESKSGNISLSVERGDFKKESYGTLIIGKDDDGSEKVWTAHPGAPAKSSGRGTFNSFKPGQKVSRKQIREVAGTDDVQVTIRKPVES